MWSEPDIQQLLYRIDGLIRTSLDRALLPLMVLLVLNILLTLFVLVLLVWR